MSYNFLMSFDLCMKHNDLSFKTFKQKLKVILFIVISYCLFIFVRIICLRFLCWMSLELFQISPFSLPVSACVKEKNYIESYIKQLNASGLTSIIQIWKSGGVVSKVFASWNNQGSACTNKTLFLLMFFLL